MRIGNSTIQAVSSRGDFNACVAFQCGKWSGDKRQPNHIRAGQEETDRGRYSKNSERTHRICRTCSHENEMASQPAAQ